MTFLWHIGTLLVGVFVLIHKVHLRRHCELLAYTFPSDSVTARHAPRSRPQAQSQPWPPRLASLPLPSWG
mgnify:CR=1 FL=1